MYAQNNFRKKAFKHLGEFKVNKLVNYVEDELKESFIKDVMIGDITYQHIINPEIPEYKKYAYLPIFRDVMYEYLLNKRHNIAIQGKSHRLSSSQSLIFNFVIPIKCLADSYKKLEYDFTKFIFGIGGKMTLEHSMNDDGGGRKGTEVDLTILDKEDKLYLFEVKFTESSFGSTSKKVNDPDFQVYLDKLEGNKNEKYNLNIDRFVNYSLINSYFNVPIDKHTLQHNYQLIRNLYNVLYDGISKRTNIGKFTVIHSSRNTTHLNEFQKFKNLLNDTGLLLMKNDGFLSIEDLAEKAIEFFEGYDMDEENRGKLLIHYRMFKEMYVIS